MGSKYQRLVARGRIAAIPVVAAAAITGGVVGVTSASAKKVGSTAGAAVSKTTLTTLKKFVADQQAAPAWIAPGPAVNGKKALKGKTIVTFPISSEIDACNTKGQQGYYDAEAKALGAKVIPLQSNTGPAGWQANLSQAVTDKANAVVMLCGPSAAAVAPQLTSLKSAHIPVVDGNYNQTGGIGVFPFTGLSAESGVDTAAGRQDRSGRRADQPEGQGRARAVPEQPAGRPVRRCDRRTEERDQAPGAQVLLDRQGRGLRHAGLERPEGDRGSHQRPPGQPEHQHGDRHVRRHDRRHRERGRCLQPPATRA